MKRLVKKFFGAKKCLPFADQRICLIDGKDLAFQIPHLVLHALFARPGMVVDTLKELDRVNRA